MRKRFCVLFSVFLVLLYLVGYITGKLYVSIPKEEKAVFEVQEELGEQSLERTDKQESYFTNICNPFWESEASFICELKYDYKSEIIKEERKLFLEPVKISDTGILYKLDLDKEIPVVRFPIYLYVKEDAIYRLWESEEIIETVDSEEELLQNSMLVCQENDLPDKLEEGEEGKHHYISIEESGSICESHFYQYNDYENVVGYWEGFVWKKGKGLMGYRSGYSAQAELVELKRKE